MPLFMDVHERLPAAVAAADVHRDMRARRGARCLRYWHAAEAGKLFCLVEAPSAEAAASVHHRVGGLQADRIYEVIESEPSLAGWEGNVSDAPFFFINTHKIQAGKADEFRAYAKKYVKLVADEEPQLIGFNLYINEDGTEFSCVQVHPNAASMGRHMEVVQAHMEEAYEYIEAGHDRFHVFGAPIDGLLQALEQIPGSGVSVTTGFAGGFLRT